MGEALRVGATGLVWMVFTAFMFGLFAMASDAYGGGYYFVAMAITATLAVFAFMLTGRLWRRGEAPDTHQSLRRTKAPAAKLKRTHEARLATLMDALDDEDILDLETLVQARADQEARLRAGD